MFDRGPSPLGVVAGIGFIAQLRQASRQERQKANMRQRRQAVEVLLCWLLFWSSSLSFSRSLSTSKRISSAQELAVPCPCSFAVCSDYSFAKGMVVSTVSAVFAPAVPPHSGCFIQKTWADSPCLTPVCFHSASVSKLFFLPTSYFGAAAIERKK